MKKVVYLVLICISLLTLKILGNQAFAETVYSNYEITEDMENKKEKGTQGLIYSSDGTKITGYTGTDTDIVIPFGVIYIEKEAFGRFTNGDSLKITSVDIPNSVKYIGESAFESNDISNLTIPESVIFIDSLAFANNGMKSVTFVGGNLESIGGMAFSNNYLSNVVVPSSVVSMSNTAFWHNEMSYFEVPGSVDISIYAFDQTINKTVLYQPTMTLEELGKVNYIHEGVFSENNLDVRVTSVSNKKITYNDEVFSIEEGIQSFSYKWEADYRFPPESGLVGYMGEGETRITFDYSLFNSQKEAIEIINSLPHLTNKGKEIFNEKIRSAQTVQEVNDKVDEAKKIDDSSFNDLIKIYSNEPDRVLVNKNGTLKKDSIELNFDWLMKEVPGNLVLDFSIPEGQGSKFIGVKELDGTHYTISEDGRSMSVHVDETVSAISIEADLTGDGELIIESQAMYSNELLNGEYSQKFNVSMIIQSVLIGDLNDDGRVTILDLSLLKYYLNSGVYLDNVDKELFDFAADINGDGGISLTDMGLLKFMINSGVNSQLKGVLKV